MPRIVEPTPLEIATAARDLRDGGVVAFPTETVYGLGVDTFNERALDRLYEMKGRPADNPLIAHVADAEGAKRVVADWDDRCERLADAFWPGPLTLVVPKAHDVPARATASRPTIAVRAPRHAAARDLLVAFGGPLSAPSANRSGRVSPTTARHVADDFPNEPDLVILDGGSCEVGLESTVLDLSGAGDPVILRPGGVTRAALEAIVGSIGAPELSAQAASPGTSPRHYAPRTPAELVESDALDARLREAAHPVVVLAFDADGIAAPHTVIAMPRDAAAYGRRLYDALRAADARRARCIVIEMPPADEAWRVVHDRLRRATA